MKDNVLDEVIKVNNDLIIPGYIVRNYKELDLEGLELILLLYFINQKNNVTFDVNKISLDLNIDSKEVLELINNLSEKNYISIEMKKTNGVIEEFITTDLFFNKVKTIIIDNEKNENESDIYSVFEKELGRTLSPTEINTIDSWIQNEISEELIIEALKEAILSGVNNFRYIDSILFNWVKKGYKKREDIVRKKETKEEKIEEIYDYDWLNE